MATLGLLSGGTISVSAASTAVSGVGTAFTQAYPGAVIFAGGLSVPILSIESDTGLTLSQGWPGTTLSAADYDIQMIGLPHALAAQNQQRVQELLGALSLKGAILTGDGVPGAGLGTDDDIYLDETALNLYKKASGAWSLVWTGTITSPDVSTLTVLTQAAYDALTPDANTLYAITET